MKCNICGINEAAVHLTEVINEKVTKLHLCEACAKSKSEEMQSHFGLTDLLSGLMDFGTSIAEEEPESGGKLKCPVCKMTYYDFQKIGRLGCGECYETFSSSLSELLRKIHGSDRHVGKRPLKIKRKMPIKKEQDIQELRDSLKKYIQTEEFEKAAELRDKIKEVEKKLKKVAKKNSPL
ncbi:MAG: UvrB/UvrC motif-containing protein [Candidatus Omnitrophota bacterium]